MGYPVNLEGLLVLYHLANLEALVAQYRQSALLGLLGLLGLYRLSNLEGRWHRLLLWDQLAPFLQFQCPHLQDP